MAGPKSITGNRLTPKQDRFLVELLDCASMRDAAERVKVAAQTASGWLRIPAVREEFQRRRNAALQEAMTLLQTATTKATQKLLKHLDNEEPEVSMEAARIITANAIRLFEIQAQVQDVQDLREQVSRLLDEQARINQERRREAFRGIQGGLLSDGTES